MPDELIAEPSAGTKKPVVDRRSYPGDNPFYHIVADLHKIYRHGMVVNGGFILGFDGETSNSARKLVEVIEHGKIVMSMVGLLFALPNTRLTRRLREEQRLLQDTARLSAAAEATEVDQTTSGLNFITRRPRADVLGDFLHVLKSAYSTRNYFDRCLQVSRALRIHPRFSPPWRRKVRCGIAFLKIVVKLGLRPSSSYYYWRNFLAVLFTRVSSLETVVKTTVFLRDMNDFARMNAVYGEFFTSQAPARSTFQVAGLPKGAAVEIEAIAIRQEK